MSIAARLAEIHELPTLPEVALKLRRLILSDEGNAASLARIIEHDPPLSARVLKVANSSFYFSPAGPIVSVERAVARIGFNEIGNLALAASVIKLFSRKSSVIDYPGFWRHSISAAYLSSMMGELLSPGRFQEGMNDYFLAGLLHDIGILIYDQFFNKEFQSIRSFAAEKHVSFIEAENRVIPDDTHASVGGALLELWNINGSAVESVKRHHDPIAGLSGSIDSITAAAVALSELLLRSKTVSPDAFEGTIDPVSDDLIAALELQKEGLPLLILKTKGAMDQADALFG
jgi:HD-like signal output (HDOD) protein